MTQSSDSIPKRAIPLPPPPPLAPRQLTPLAIRRAWTEPRVRLWWLLAAAILSLILIYALDRIWEHGKENRLITDGVSVQAKVVEANGLRITNQSLPPDSAVVMEFDWHGQTVQVNGFLEDWTQYIVVGKTVPIRVDANNPQTWTARSEPAPLLHELFLGFVLSPLVPLFALIANLKRRYFLQTWQRGEPAMAIVSDRRQAPIAPLSYIVRCSLPDRGDKRILTVFVPSAGRALRRNDPLWIVLPPRGSKKGLPPVAAMWFE